MNQIGPVWFIAGTFGGPAERTCAVPSGKAILTPILSSYCTYLTDSAKTKEELRNCAREGNDDVSLEVSVDGVQLQNLRETRITSELSNFTIAPDNPFGLPAGNTQAIVDGYFLFLKPLSQGEHVIHFASSTVDNPTTGTQSYSTEATYHLTVR